MAIPRSGITFLRFHVPAAFHRPIWNGRIVQVMEGSYEQILATLQAGGRFHFTSSRFYHRTDRRHQSPTPKAATMNPTTPSAQPAPCRQRARSPASSTQRRMQIGINSMWMATASCSSRLPRCPQLDIDVRLWNSNKDVISDWFAPLAKGGDTEALIDLPAAGVYYLAGT